MKTIDEAAKELACKYVERDKFYVANTSDFIEAFESGVSFSQQWNSVEDELPETPLTDIENVQYSEHILLKVNGYDHPFIGYYMKANDDEFFEFVPESITNEFTQELITHWRPIDIK